MSVKIRLSRYGRKNLSFFRFSVAHSRRSPTGKFLQQIGYYDPNQDPPIIKIDEASAIAWLSKGAEMSPTVRSLFRRYGVLEKFEQVKSGTPLEDTVVKVKEWKKKKKKPSKKAQEKAKEDGAKEQTEKPVKAKEEAKEEQKPEKSAAKETSEEKPQDTKSETKEEQKAQAEADSPPETKAQEEQKEEKK